MTKKSDGTRLALTGIRQNSEVALAAQLGWLMTEELGRRSLDKEKQRHPCRQQKSRAPSQSSQETERRF